jgi:hypothetical protein
LDGFLVFLPTWMIIEAESTSFSGGEETSFIGRSKDPAHTFSQQLHVQQGKATCAYR